MAIMVNYKTFFKGYLIIFFIIDLATLAEAIIMTKIAFDYHFNYQGLQKRLVQAKAFVMPFTSFVVVFRFNCKEIPYQ